ncbi:MAG: hypothetical protein CMK89_03520 [Pseudomonadales bacterium]|nr:hypothetical protein [Pseudomonadales bacterium]
MSKLQQVYTKERLKLVLDSTRLGMWDWNPQTNEVLFDQNWAQMLGLELSELSMTLADWSSRVHPDDMDKCLQEIQAHINGETAFYENLHRMKHADGHWVYILDRGKVVESDELGNPIRFTGTHADVTPLKQAEFEASLAMKAKERFFSAMSHELRAPMHAMLGIVEQVQKQLQQDDLKQQLKVVQDSGQHLLLLINDVLGLARLHHDNPPLDVSTCSLIDLVHHVVHLFGIRAQEKGLQFTSQLSLSKSDSYVKTDCSRLSQVIINLVSNAIKFTDSGSVTVRLDTVPDGLRIQVTDSGRGIEDVERIFQPFFSTEALLRLDDVQSTGLGLSISQELVKTLGLTLDVESELGSGTVFSVLVPENKRCAAPVDALDSVAERQGAEPTWPGKTVLLVDDTPINLMLAEMMLEDSQLTILKAASGTEALDVLQRASVDLIVTDLHMPRMGGLQLAEQVRSLSLPRPMSLVVTSADTKNDVWERCREAGIDDYLEKPFDAEQLLAMVGKYLAS